MPLPRLLAQINKRVFNPREVRKGARPVLIHAGRSSGATYRTPMDAHRIDGGYVFFPLYGPRTDWVRNVLTAGSATLRVDETEVALSAPRMIAHDEVVALLPRGVKPPSARLAPELLRMDIDAAL